MKKSYLLSSLLITIVLFGHHAYAQTWEWVNSYTSPGNGGSYFEELTYDNEGSLIAAGVIQDTAEFATDTLASDYSHLPSPAYGDMVIAKFDADTGQEQWVKSFGGYGYSVIFDVVTDPALNIYCAGYFWDTLHVDNDTLISGGSADAVLIKLDPNGQVLWHRQFEGTSGFIQNNAIDITENGTVVMLADYDNAFTVDGTFIQSLNQSQFTNLFIGGFHQNGDLLWHYEYVGANTVFTSTGLDIRGDKMAICGAFEGSLQLGSNVYPSNSDMEWDIFTAQLDTLGNIDWVRPVNSNWYEYVYDVEIDVNNNVTSVGYFPDTIDFGGLTSPLEQEFPYTVYGSFSGSSIFIVQYDSQGVAQWSKTRPTASYGSLHSIESDEFANIFVSGAFNGVDTIAGTPIESWGVGTQYYICAMDPLGNEQWIAWNYPGSGHARGLIYNDGFVYACGNNYCDSQFGPIVVSDPYGTCHWQPALTKISNDVLNVNTIDPIEGFALYPNPATDQLHILHDGNAQVNYQIFDLNGKMLLEGKENHINIASLASGVYVINCTFGDHVQTEKFVKQ